MTFEPRASMDVEKSPILRTCTPHPTKDIETARRGSNVSSLSFNLLDHGNSLDVDSKYLELALPNHQISAPEKNPPSDKSADHRGIDRREGPQSRDTERTDWRKREKKQQGEDGASSSDSMEDEEEGEREAKKKRKGRRKSKAQSRSESSAAY